MRFSPKSYPHMLGRFQAFILTSTGAFSLEAATLLNEPFHYVDGSLVLVANGIWSTHSGTTGEVEVISGRVDLQIPATEDVNASLGQSFPANASVSLYASFTVNFSMLPSASGAYFAHFKGSGTSVQRGKVFAFTTGAGAGQYRIGLANIANVPVLAAAGNLNTNLDYRIYLRYAISTATATLWVDPESEASPSITATDIAAPAAVTSFALRQDAGIGVMALDDLRVGTSFADVYTGTNLILPVITQQPANTAAVEGGIANFTVVATGTAPLSYQWKFDGTSLPGATNTSLTLNNLTTNQAGPYSVTVSNAAGSTNSLAANLTVIGPSSSGTVTLVQYNLKGNFASDWSTNAAQVQAIARELQYLNPDIITLNEIPNGLHYEMTNWMTAFFPAYSLAISSNTDGAIRSGFISRYPFTRTQSWLAAAGLTNFGYTGTFTRDLFEAEIFVPGASEPLHVFTTHLKSGSDTDSQDRRAAECSAVSNFFARVFVPAFGARPYVLTGDLNEDLAIPMSQNLQAIQRLVSTPTGLKLTTPLNPFTSSRFTHSIQGSLDARFDYVMPAGVLSSNSVASQVFRTDVLPPPLPPNLFSNDDMVASDHLPVVMVFNYPDPALRVTLTVSNSTLVLRWPTLIGRNYRVESSGDLANWTVAASNITTLTSHQTWAAPTLAASQYYRVLRTQ